MTHLEFSPDSLPPPPPLLFPVPLSVTILCPQHPPPPLSAKLPCRTRCGISHFLHDITCLWWCWDRDLFLCGIQRPREASEGEDPIRSEGWGQATIMDYHDLRLCGERKKWVREREHERKGVLDDIIIAEHGKTRIVIKKLQKVSPWEEKMCLIFHDTGTNHHLPHIEHTRRRHACILLCSTTLQ